MSYTSKDIENKIAQVFLGGYAKYLIWNNPVGDLYVIPTALIV
jgi:hypothetical protein